jgi:DNA helicase-2/ATP-dependent DNA helicase PcrA
MAATKEQQAVVDHGAGPARLLAGPGTGKSFTLSRRVEALVAAGHDPRRMLLLSFTRLAAADLAEGLASSLDTDTRPEASTLHSYAFRQLRSQSGEAYVGRHVVDDWELKNLIRTDLCRRLGMMPGRVSELFKAYDAAYRTLGPPPDFPERAAFERAIEDLRQVLHFALPEELVEMFRRVLDSKPDFDPELDFLIVDEYQDLNLCDQEVIRRLADTGAALLVAGDDDQSLYSFRHANPDGIVGFAKEFDPCGDYALTECRRCSVEILGPALQLIQHNSGRAPKALHSNRTGGEVHAYSFPGQRQQAGGIARLIAAERDAGTDLSKVFVLLPRKNFAEIYLEEFGKLGLPVVDLANGSKLMEERDIRRLLYLLRFVADRNDAMAVRGWLGTTRGLGAVRIGKVLDLAISSKVSLARAIEQSDIEPVRKEFALLTDLANQIDSEQLFQAFDTAVSLIGVNDALAASLRLMLGALGEDAPLASSLGRIHELREQPEGEGADAPAIKLMSLHGAKGLTADVAFIPDAEDELIPGNGDVIEQRRLMYVSMTRARNRLYITHCQYRSGATGFAGRGASSTGLNRRRSRFLDDAGLRSENPPKP